MHTITNTLSRRIRRTLAAAALATMAVSSLAGCGSGTSAANADGSTTTAAPDSSVSTTLDSSSSDANGQPENSSQNGASGNSDGNQNNNSGGNSGSDNGNSGNSSGDTGGTSTPAPKFLTFENPPDVDCHNGNSQSFGVQWTTENAINVTVAIDGPGIYDTYGPTETYDTMSLPFNCSTEHTFLFTAHGADGQTATKEITLQPRNAQSSAQSQDEED